MSLKFLSILGFRRKKLSSERHDSLETRVMFSWQAVKWQNAIWEKHLRDTSHKEERNLGKLIHQIF